MLIELNDEVRRQAQVCNSCRYCEGFCAVFPAMHAECMFSDDDITQLTNLGHNCQNCYHARQYTAPHEFEINLPQILAQTRQKSWEEHAWPPNLRLGAICPKRVVGAALVLLRADSEAMQLHLNEISKQVGTPLANSKYRKTSPS